MIWPCQSLLFILCAMLTACGFHLRGLEKSQSLVQPVFIQTKQPQHPFIRSMRQTLINQGIILTNHVLQAQTQLTISALRYQRQTLTSDRQTATSQQNLHLSFDFTVQTPQFKLKTQTISINRNFVWQQNTLAASQQQYQQIRKNLFEQATANLLRQLMLNHDKRKNQADELQQTQQQLQRYQQQLPVGPRSNL